MPKCIFVSVCSMVHLMLDRLQAEAGRLARSLGLTPLARALQALRDEEGEAAGEGPVRLASERMAAVQAVVQGLVDSLLQAREETR